MELKDKIKKLLKALKESRFVILNGMICCCNKSETFENKKQIEKIYFDDASEDDYYNSININEIQDIELVNGTFKVILNEKYYIIHILVIKRYKWS